jgi:predicted RecA/RadA family phage recombinase
MKNFIQRGEVITLAAPYDVASGAGLLVGTIFGVATSAALSGEAVETAVCGVYELAKTSAQAWTVGAKIYWDDTAKVCTTVTTSNTLIGVAVAAAANPSAAGLVRLNGSF